MLCKLVKIHKQGVGGQTLHTLEAAGSCLVISPNTQPAPDSVHWLLPGPSAWSGRRGEQAGVRGKDASPQFQVEEGWAGMLGMGNPPGGWCEVPGKEEGAGLLHPFTCGWPFTCCLSKAGKEGLNQD